MPIDEAVLVTIAAQLFTWVAELHAMRTRIGGIHPELVFVIDDRLAGVCPSGIEFIATAPQPMHGPRSYRVPYLAPEVLFTGQADLASDVFAACATLFFLGTGRHPFGDAGDVRQLMQRTQSGRIEAWQGDAELGECIASGLARDAGARPSAVALRDRFDQLRARDH